MRRVNLQNVDSALLKVEHRLALGKSCPLNQALRRPASTSAAFLGLTLVTGVLVGLSPTQAANALEASQPEVSGVVNGSLSLASSLSAEAAIGIGKEIDFAATEAPLNLILAVAPSGLMTPLSATSKLPASADIPSANTPSPVTGKAVVNLVILPLLSSSMTAATLGQQMSTAEAMPLSAPSKVAFGADDALAQPAINQEFSTVSTIGLQPQDLAEADPLKTGGLLPEVEAESAATTDSVTSQPETRNIAVALPTALSNPQAQSLPLHQQIQQNWLGEVKRQVIAQVPGMGSNYGQGNPDTLVSSSQFSAPITRRTLFPQLPNLELPPLSPAERYLPGNSSLTSQFMMPARGIFTSGFGPRWGRMHRGIDIAAPVGTPVVASADGVIVTSEWNSGGYGNLVEIRHPDGSLTLYGHNNRLLARVGQQVRQGEQIAEMGSTGRSTGPHVHFEIHPPGQGAVNPMLYLGRG